MFMSDQNISQEQINMHQIIFGQSGSGKSLFIQRHADDNNISYDEAEKAFQPSEEQLKESKKAKAEAQINDKKRLLATKLTYWEHSTFDKFEFSNFHDCLTSYLDIDEPTDEQIKTLYLMIPDDMFGLGISWGFGDSVLRDNLSKYVQDNIELIKQKLSEIKVSLVKKNLIKCEQRRKALLKVKLSLSF